MSLQRRDFMKGLLATGAVVAGASAVAGDAAADRPRTPERLVLLRTGTVLDDAFAAGVGDACRALGRPMAQVRTVDPMTLLDPRVQATLLDPLAGAALVGLMEDGAYTLFEEAVRGRKGRLLLAGQHTWTGDGSGGSRHLMRSGPGSRGVGGAVSDAAGGAPVAETTLGPAHRGTGRVASLAGARMPFARALGEAMGRVALGAWRPGPARRAGVNIDLPADGPRRSAVSFAVAV